MRNKRLDCLLIVVLLLLPLLLIPVLAAKNTDPSSSINATVPPIQRGHVTFDVYVYRNSEMSSTTASPLNNYITTASNSINQKFNVSYNRVSTLSSTLLDQRDGCSKSRQLYCDAACGTVANCTDLHHKSGAHFINELSRANRKVFRYVNYAICHYTSDNGHEGIYGLASADDKDIIVSSMSYNIQRTVTHELSHWIGARDKACSSSVCVMYYGGDTTNKWCTNCSQDINAYMDEYWEDMS